MTDKIFLIIYDYDHTETSTEEVVIYFLIPRDECPFSEDELRIISDWDVAVKFSPGNTAKFVKRYHGMISVLLQKYGKNTLDQLPSVDSARVIASRVHFW